MKTYAVALSKQHVALLVSLGFNGVLVSFAHDKRGAALEPAVGTEVRVMLDSGAFTAWTTGREVDIDELIAYAHAQRSRFPAATVINLDVIPGDGKHQEKVTDAMKRAAIRASARNAGTLRAAGLPVMEVYHFGEPLKVLDAIVERRQPGELIGFGGLAAQAGRGSFAPRHEFVRAAFAHLSKRHGLGDLPPVHGLGVAPDGPLGGTFFPWVSVDCSSWETIGKYGVKVLKGGKRMGGRSDKRTSNVDVRRFYTLRVLERWMRLDEAYARLWASRGVQVQP